MIPGSPDDLAQSLILRLLRGSQPNRTIPTAAPSPQPSAPVYGGPMTQAPEEIPPLGQPPTPKIAPTASLLNRAEHIKNPIGRVAGTIGAGLLQGLDVIGSAAAPQYAKLIPGSTLNTALGNRASLQDWEKQQQLQTSRLTLKPPKEDTVTSGGVAYEKTPTGWQPIGQPKQEKPDTPEQQFIDDYIQRNPGKNVQDAVTAYAAATQKPPQEKPDTATQEDQRYEGIVAKQSMKQPVTPEDQAWARAYEKRKTLAPAASAALSAPSKEDAALDRSYTQTSGQLEKIRTPIDQISSRMTNLTSNVNFHTPQADSLIAPELLSIMAGGQGSGLRMNEAEISRIIGGATNWTQLQTALNKWSTDPQHATFTDSQRNQMRQIIGAAQAKVNAKQSILEDAEQRLIDSTDKKTQRQVVADARKLLDAVDQGKKIIRKDGVIQVAQ